MNAYYIQDRLEAQSWARHYQQIAREEKEAELADDMEKGLPQHLFESLCIGHLQRHGASKKAITRAFDDDVEFQERMAEHIRYMVETIAHHQVDIDSVNATMFDRYLPFSCPLNTFVTDAVRFAPFHHH